MRRVVLLLLILLAVSSSYAQSGFTSVTGQVKDSNSVPYANCSVTANFVDATGVTTRAATINGSPIPSRTIQSACDANGNFTIVVEDSAVVVPLGTTWQFTFSYTQHTTGLPNPAGQSQAPNFSYIAPICPNAGCITGASISITSAISSLVPTLNFLGIGTLISTGNPSSGNLAKWSGGNSITNGDLTGDVTTSGGVATTLATVATPATNTKITYNAKGLVTSGSQAQFSDVGGAIASAQQNSATSGALGAVELNTDLGGTATAPTVVGLRFGATDLSLSATPPASGQLLFNSAGSIAGTTPPAGSTVFNTTASATNANIGSQTMIASTPGNQNYLSTFYVAVTTAASGCSVQPTYQVVLSYTDAFNSLSLAYNIPLIQTGTATISTSSTFTNGGNLEWFGTVPFRAKTGTSISYNVNFQAGTGCSTNPSYSVAPNLTQQ